MGVRIHCVYEIRHQDTTKMGASRICKENALHVKEQNWATAYLEMEVRHFDVLQADLSLFCMTYTGISFDKGSA